MGLNPEFKGRQFTAPVILWAIRWYLMFPISYRDLELMLLDRGVTVDFLLSAKRDAAAAKRFFRKALAQPHT